MPSAFWLEEAVLTAMGCDLSNPAVGETVCHLLVMPRVAAYCCVTLAARHTGLTAGAAILQRSDVEDVRTVLGRQDAAEWATFPVGRLDLHVKLGAVPADLASTVGQLGDFVDRREVPPAEQVRHEAFVFVKVLGRQPLDVRIEVSGGWVDTMPTHAALLDAIWKVTAASFGREPLRTYLDHRLPRRQRVCQSFRRRAWMTNR